MAYKYINKYTTNYFDEVFVGSELVVACGGGCWNGLLSVFLHATIFILSEVSSSPWSTFIVGFFTINVQTSSQRR